MTDYKLTKKIDGAPSSTIIKIKDGVHSSFEPDPKNCDYQAYLAWVALGNTPQPADSNQGSL